MRGNLRSIRRPGAPRGSIPACAGEPGPAGKARRRLAVYPRVCGGTPDVYNFLPPTEGLSPRVRGNQIPARVQAVIVRSIPACAGEPARQMPAGRASRVYPRVCGGTSLCPVVNGQGPGLSPRVRGNLIEKACWLRPAGSIPACAGEPITLSLHPSWLQVYPRVCGGTQVRPPDRWTIDGLSPRVRGNQHPKTRRHRQARSIPACAGEPTVARAGFGSFSVYPLVCGGTEGLFFMVRRAAGLSPRVRGNRRLHCVRVRTGRSIPACAGEPQSASKARRSDRVYPRVCGGTDREKVRDALASGLSPRVRGNLRSHLRHFGNTRSIPACAGEPVLPRTQRKSSQVYPRVCGGTTLLGFLNALADGLSPRVRGNPIERRSATGIEGSIPACAGEPPEP